jgi:rhamnose utilization protein RhaD (predicted bifunctional aldolase and dehydrogenase)
MSLRNINKISYELGADPLIIQGGGGNISYKDPKANSLWIKASGKWLENANKENVYIELDLKKGKDWLSSGEHDFPAGWQKTSTTENPLRASIETSLHLLFDKTVVVHTHPVNILSHVIHQDPRKTLAPLLADMNWALIPYRKPGRDLAHAINEHPQFGKCSIFILQNHGLVVCADTPQQAKDTTLEVIQKTAFLERDVQYDLPKIHELETQFKINGYKLPANSKIHNLACDPISFASFAQDNNVLYPDQAVFLGKNALIIDTHADINSTLKAPFIVVPNLGVFIQESSSVMVEAMLLCHAEVLSRVSEGASLNYLSDSDVAELTNWDAEKYRQAIN